MPLPPGTRLGPYEVTGLLGSGGMGEVYRARDPRLGREVAIKVLPEELARDPNRLARFRREAHILATLNHPHIAALHALEGTEETPLLILELVQGEDLATRLRRGPIPMDEALEIAEQIAEALEEAHSKGVVHRDLKPANVKLTPEGQAKVLDFGLAKAQAVTVSEESPSALSQSPTLALGTQVGTILGTAAYMSPEQARGKAVDKRADVWAFGVMVYEMLTGRQVFKGETVTDVITAVVTHDPDWTALPPTTPRPVRRLLERCLRKDPRQRLPDIGAARLELSEVRGGKAEEGTAGEPAVSRALGTTGPVEHHLLLTTDICRQLDRAELAPEVIGDHLLYSDNHVESDVLVCSLHGFGGDHQALVSGLAEVPYRSLAVTMYGFERTRTTPRTALSLRDHLTLLRHFVRQAIEDIKPRHTVLVGFSSGADVFLQLVSGWPADGQLRPDALLSLGANLSQDTCFVSGVFARQSSSDKDGLLAELRKAGVTVTTLGQWLDLHEYLVSILRKFHADLRPLRRHGQDIVRPFLDDQGTFARWYREASARVKVLRCVFADTEMEAEPARALLLSHLDTGLLGPYFRENTILIENGAGHFDLLRPDIVGRHLNEVVGVIRRASPTGGLAEHAAE